MARRAGRRGLTGTISPNLQAPAPTVILRFMEPQIAFDTHAFVKRLTGAGMPEAQAEVIARGQANLYLHACHNHSYIIDHDQSIRHDLKLLCIVNNL